MEYNELFARTELLVGKEGMNAIAVSYTHLDVYKRQEYRFMGE